MICCPDTILPFSNVTESNIPYDGGYGEKPTVTVLYNLDGVWTIKGVMTPIELQGNPVNNIYINHGEVSRGVIKIS